MLSEEQKRVIIRGIPEDFTVEGVPFHAQKIYANQYQCQSFPAIVLQYTLQDAVDNRVLKDIIVQQKKVTCTVRYMEPTHEYVLCTTKITQIVRVEGIYGDEEYVFDPSEYELVDDKIKFLGPKYPDDNTDVAVTVIASWVRRTLGAKKHDVLMVQIYAEDVFEGQRKINGIIIAEQIAKEVHQWFEYKFQRDDMAVIAISAISNTDFEIEGAITRRRTFTLNVSYWEVLEKEPIESIDVIEKVPVYPG